MVAWAHEEARWREVEGGVEGLWRRWHGRRWRGELRRRAASEGAERGGVRGRGTELGCGLGCGSAVCWMAVLVWVSGGGDLAVARARAKVR